MKRMSVFAVLLMLMPFFPLAEATTNSTYATSANMTGILSLESIMFKGEKWLTPPVTNMNFGNLVQDTPGGAFRSPDWYTMVICVHSSMRPYRVYSTAAALTNGSDSLPPGVCIMSPGEAVAIYTPGTNHSAAGSHTTPAPIGVKGPRGTFAGTDKVIYSCTNGAPAEISVVYAITNDPAQGATQFTSTGQQVGSYSGMVSISVALT